MGRARASAEACPMSQQWKASGKRRSHCNACGFSVAAGAELQVDKTDGQVYCEECWSEYYSSQQKVSAECSSARELASSGTQSTSAPCESARTLRQEPAPSLPSQPE